MRSRTTSRVVHDRSRRRAAHMWWCAAVFATAPGVAIAQDLDRALATAESGMEMEYDPPHLPGHEDGARTNVLTIETNLAAELPEWFGGKPYGEWTAATGNWGGVREWFTHHGLSFAGSYTLDWSSVWSGGVSNRASTRSLLDLNLTIDLEKFAGIRGGEFFFDFQSTDGRGGSGDVGDTHGISNIETEDNLDQIAEVWYQQWFADRLVRVKFGKVDANSEFAFVHSACTFLNSAAGVSGTMSPLPTFPDPAMSANVFVYPTSWLYFGLGIYDGATADGFATGRRGPGTFFSDKRSASWFSIGEMGVTWDNLDTLGAGRIAVGGWHHSARFDRFDGGVERGVEGFYMLAEQQLFGSDEAESDRGLYAFLRYGWADENVSAAAQHIGGGLTLRGTFPGRENDEAGVFVSTLLLSNARGSAFDGNETVVELYYRFNLTPFVHITPDLQWISNPSGDRSVDDAVVGAVRLEVDF